MLAHATQKKQSGPRFNPASAPNAVNSRAMIEAHISGRVYQLEHDADSGQWTVNGSPVSVDVEHLADGSRHLLVDGRSVHVRSEAGEGKSSVVEVNGQRFEVALKDHYDRLLDQLGMARGADAAQGDLKAPMPGKVLSVEVVPGQSVSKGDALLILEAMKMENVIKAPQDAVVKEVNCKQGEAVEKGVVLVGFE